jgi:hypothetical protein
LNDSVFRRASSRGQNTRRKWVVVAAFKLHASVALAMQALLEAGKLHSFRNRTATLLKAKFSRKNHIVRSASAGE